MITLRKVNLIDIDLRNENPDLLFKLQLIDSYNYLYQNNLISYSFVFPSNENKKLKEIKEKEEKEKNAKKGKKGKEKEIKEKEEKEKIKFIYLQKPKKI